jgi:lipoyl synthase
VDAPGDLLDEPFPTPSVTKAVDRLACRVNRSIQGLIALGATPIVVDRIITATRPRSGLGYKRPMSNSTPSDYDATVKQKSQAKTSRIPIKVVPAGEVLKKPEWIRVKAGSPSTRFYEIKNILREHRLVTVCEEASCPNIGECFGKGTATFMIMGDKCTRRCPFCDVGHGRPDPLDAEEPDNLAKTIAKLKLKYVVITSVDRDDLRDGGAAHFVACIQKVRELSPETRIEILTPDFRGRLDRALGILREAPPDVMNHNMETVPRLYKEARPGSDYAFSLSLLQQFKQQVPGVPTKSGLMVGLGETDDEILAVMRDMRAHNIDMLTIGQYLAPSGHHLPVKRYVHPDTFAMFEREALAIGFTHAAVGAMVRSSYHADQQAHAAGMSGALG